MKTKTYKLAIYQDLVNDFMFNGNPDVYESMTEGEDAQYVRVSEIQEVIFPLIVENNESIIKSRRVAAAKRDVAKAQAKLDGIEND